MLEMLKYNCKFDLHLQICKTIYMQENSMRNSIYSEILFRENFLNENAYFAMWTLRVTGQGMSLNDSNGKSLPL